MHGHIDVYSVFLEIAIILLTAQLFGLAFKRLGIPPVLGEVTAGIVLGASVLGLVEMNAAIQVLAELGIILLLFQVGLEVDFKALVRSGLWAAVVALLGALLPFLGGYWVSNQLFGLSPTASLFIGGALTATSIGITIRVLTDLGKQHEEFAQIVLGAAVLDDVLGVILLTGVYEFAKNNGFELATTARLAFFIVFFLVIAPFATQIIVQILLWIIDKFNTKEVQGVGDREKDLAVIPPVVMSLVLGAAYFAHKFGSPSILGTFTAGIALSQKFPRIDIRKTYHRAKSWLTKTACPPEVKAAANPLERVIENIEQTVFTLVWIFGPIFFVSVGLALNLKEIDFSSPKFWLLSLSLLAVAVVGKVAAGFFVLGRSLKEKAAIGFSMLPRGEVGLIFAEFGRAMGVINATEYAVVIFVVAITTLIAPLALKLLLKN